MSEGARRPSAIEQALTSYLRAWIAENRGPLAEPGRYTVQFDQDAATEKHEEIMAHIRDAQRNATASLQASLIRTYFSARAVAVGELVYVAREDWTGLLAIQFGTFSRVRVVPAWTLQPRRVARARRRAGRMRAINRWLERRDRSLA